MSEYNSAYTGIQIDNAIGRALRTPNPNLLDNAYFGNPVDQRGGYVVPPGVVCYSDNALANVVGTTDKYFTAWFDSAYPNNAFFNISDGAVYAVPRDSVVRGYTGAGYTIDRWAHYTSGTVLIENSCIVLKSANSGIKQRFEDSFADNLTGETVTMSALLVQGGNTFLVSGTLVYDKTKNQQYFVLNGGIANNVSLLYDNNAFAVWSSAAETKILAAGLDLGTEQTLAHQDANGNWVLNKIPSFAEELAKCQWYSRKMYVAMQGVQDVYGLLRQSFTFPSMRITPTATLSKSGGTEPNAEIALLNNGGFALSASGSEESFKNWYGYINLDANL